MAARTRSHEQPPVLTEPLLNDAEYAQQRKIEEEAFTRGTERYWKSVRHRVKAGDAVSIAPIARLGQHWFEPLTAVIRERRRLDSRGYSTNGKVTIALPLFRLLTAERVAALCLRTTLGLLNSAEHGPHYKIRLRPLLYALGNNLVGEIHMRMLRRYAPHEVAQLNRAMLNPSKRQYGRNARTINRFAMLKLDYPITEHDVKMAAGDFMLEAMRDSCTVGDYDEDVWVDAFDVIENIEEKNGRQHRVRSVRLSLAARQAIERGHQQRAHMRPTRPWMIVPPATVTSIQSAGYLTLPFALVTNCTPAHRRLIEAAKPTRVFDAMNAIGNVPGTTHELVLDTVQALWDRGGGRVGLEPRDLPAYPKRPPESASDLETRQYRFVRDHIKDERRRLPGAWVTRTQMLREARRVLSWERGFAPAYLDTRSRVYSGPTDWNHQMDDVARGLYLFAESVPLTDDGWRELLIHAANCWGLDKEPYEARLRWAEERKADMIRAAKDPLGERWWEEADEPVQFLAACSGVANPKEIGSRLPVQKDATCSGYQHYAAIIRDEHTARAVNLMDTGNREDAYTMVLERMRPAIEADARRGVTQLIRRRGGSESIQLPAAELVLEHLVRPVTKRAQVADVYGMTQYGAATALGDALYERGMTNPDECQAARWYLSRKLSEAMEAAMPKTRAAMAYLKKVATVVVDEGKAPMQWTTPMGWPVLQDGIGYTTHPARQIKTAYGRVIGRPALNFAGEPIRRRQINAFPPNWIHSIDACHLMESILSARKRQIRMLGVHDCFWTHASHWPVVDPIIREEFVKLHQRPMLEVLAEQLAEQHPDLDIPSPPETGSFDLDQVLTSPYIVC